MVVADAAAVAPELDATPVVVKLEIDVPRIVSRTDVELEPLAEGGVETATVLRIGFDVAVVAVAYGLIVKASL